MDDPVFGLDPPVGPPLRQLVASGRLRIVSELAAPARMQRRPFFISDQQELGSAEFGHHLTDPAFAAYTAAGWFVAAGDQAAVLGSDGVVAFDGRLLPDTLSAISFWESTSLTRHLTPHTALRLRRPVPISRRISARPCLVGFTPAWRNYAHWLQQNLPILAAFRWLKQASPDLTLLLPPFAPGSFHQQTVDGLGIGADEIEVIAHDEAVAIDCALVASPIDIWSVPPGAPLAARLLAMQLPPGGVCAGDRVFIHRRGPARRLANIADLAPVLDACGFTVVSFEDMPLASQVSIMRAARFVIGEHGAGLANILFCRPGTRVIELFNPVCVQPAFWSVASAAGLDHGYLIGEGATPDAPSDWNSSYTISPQRLADAIGVMLGDLPGNDPSASQQADLAAAYPRGALPPEGLGAVEPGASTAQLLMLDTFHGTRLYWDALVGTIRHGPASVVPANLLLRVERGRGQFVLVGGAGALLTPLRFDPRTRRGAATAAAEGALAVQAAAGRLALSMDDLYLSAEPQGFITADRESRHDWETFVPSDLPDLHRPGPPPRAASPAARPTAKSAS